MNRPTPTSDTGRNPVGFGPDQLVAIDFHTHVLASVRDEIPKASESSTALAEYFGTDVSLPTVRDLAAYYNDLQMMCVVFSVDSTSATGNPNRVSNDEICEVAAEFPRTVIPFGSVDPHAGKFAAREVARLAAAYPIKGFKFHPNSQAFHPNDPAVYPIYEAIQEAGLIALFHSGHTGVGAGRRGGNGIRLKFSNPMAVDDVAVDFPDLKIVLAHPSFPWQDEAISVALHKPNVYIDLSGWSPKYFPPNLIQYARTLLKKKVLFGTDFPVITPAKWIEEFSKLGLDAEVTQLIMKHNAWQLLELG